MANAETGPAEAGASLKSNRGRSYPTFSLGDGLRFAEKMYERAKRSFVPVSIACNYWGYKATSSSGMRCLAGMLAYGLLDGTGTRANKQVKLSDRANELLRNPNKNSPEYRQLLRETALRPTILQEIYDRYQSEGELPADDEAFAWELENRLKISESGTRQLIAVARDTFALAGLFGDAMVGDPGAGSEGGTPPPAGAPGNTAMTPAAPPAMPPPPASPPGLYGHAPATTARDVALPLISGGTAILRLPYLLSQEDLAWIKDTLLDKLKRGILDPRGVPLTVGDHVQWESQGVLQFQAARRVTRVEEGYVFVEGSETGIPIDQVRRT